MHRETKNASAGYRADGDQISERHGGFCHRQAQQQPIPGVSQGGSRAHGILLQRPNLQYIHRTAGEKEL